MSIHELEGFFLHFVKSGGFALDTSPAGAQKSIEKWYSDHDMPRGKLGNPSVFIMSGSIQVPSAAA